MTSSKKSTNSALSVFHKATGNKWIPILNTFTPLGPIADAFAQILTYKIESEKLNVELSRINADSAIKDKVVEKTYALKIEELEQKRSALNGLISTAQGILKMHHVPREKALEAAEKALQMCFNTSLSLEERSFYKDLCTEATKLIPVYNENDNVTLQKLVEGIPKVEITKELLPEKSFE